MKIKITVNGKHLATGEVRDKGHLGAHINLDDKTGSGNPAMDIAISGYDTSNPEETKYLKWATAALQSGDHIAIEMRPDTPADEPIEIISSLKDKKSISTTEEQAERILKAAYTCNDLLDELLRSLKEELSVEDYRKLAYGVGTVINEVFSSVAEPIYRKHPSKVPQELENMPL
jgi:hypothetical protein